MKKILIISNNVLSSQYNNGKTLLSFFEKHPKSCLAQLYFSNEPLEADYVSTSYRISDEDVLRSIFPYKTKAGTEISFIEPSESKLKIKLTGSKIKNLKHSSLMRLLRELVWKISNINKQSLSKWLAAFNPDVIFFCAGDSLFAYDIYNFVCEQSPKAKKVIYVTDDYVLPIKTLNLVSLLRRRLVLSKMKKAVSESNVFITISEEMRIEYKKLFNKDSILAFNMSCNLKIDGFVKTERPDLLLVYTGGLHFKRWETLAELAKALNNFNKLNNRQVFFEIYSNQDVSKDILAQIEIQGTSKFCGGLNESGVQHALNNADILVHAESFEESCIQSTRLSISTKIAEYISVGGRILAIGPADIASMNLLKKHVTCINNLEDIESKILILLDKECTFQQDLSVLKRQILKNKISFNLNVIN